MASGINVSIAGSVNSGAPDYNPFVQLRGPDAQELLLRVAREPQPVDAVDKGLLARLVGIEALRLEDGLCFVNFPCLLADDMALLARVAGSAAEGLARRVVRETGDVEALARSCAHPQPGAAKMLLILVGCVGLDWGGLRVLSERGCCITNPSKPGGNHYVLFGHEAPSSVAEGRVYCGSNSGTYGRWAFTSFGAGSRDCFPDLFWRLGPGGTTRLKPAYAAQLFASLGDRDIHEWAELLAAVLAGEARDPAASDLLECLAYTRGGVPNVPLLVEADKPIVEEAKRRVDGVVERWAEAEYAPLRTELASLGPNRWGVPYGETFNLVWHAVFGRANGILAEQGFFFDPGGSASEFDGYLPCVHEAAAGL